MGCSESQLTAVSAGIQGTGKPFLREGLEYCFFLSFSKFCFIVVLSSGGCVLVQYSLQGCESFGPCDTRRTYGEMQMCVKHSSCIVHAAVFF